MAEFTSWSALEKAAKKKMQEAMKATEHRINKKYNKEPYLISINDSKDGVIKEICISKNTTEHYSDKIVQEEDFKNGEIKENIKNIINEEFGKRFNKR